MEIKIGCRYAWPFKRQILLALLYLFYALFAIPVFAQNRIEAQCKKDAVVVFAFGQSNSANHAYDLRDPKNPRILNFFGGHCYLARDPLLGASGKRGSVWTPFAEKLSSGGETIILVTIGVGNTSVKDWASGYLSLKLKETLTDLFGAGLRPTYIFWHQGERDAKLKTTDYIADFGKIVEVIRGFDVDVPIFAAISTVCNGEKSELIRRQQKLLSKVFKGVKQGPDTDKLGPESRPDGCHILAGAHADLWLDVIRRD